MEYLIEEMVKVVTSIEKDAFVMKANKVHGMKYDYSDIEYMNPYTKITVKCLTHGSYSIKPNDHLYGRGCNECESSKHVYVTSGIMSIQSRKIY